MAPRNPAPGFYARLDRGYERLLRLAMRHRPTVIVISLGIIFCSVPLYKLIRQEYIPSNADEGEFDLFVAAPEGLSLQAMDEITRMIEDEVRPIRGVETVLASVGGGLGNINQVRTYVRLKPHDERIFSVGRLVSGLFHGRPQARFQGQLFPGRSRPGNPQAPSQISGPPAFHPQRANIQYWRQPVRG